jgi:hypothetical protein
MTSLSLLALVGLGSCDATQPKPQCKTQPSDFAAKYTLVGTPEGMCEGKTPGGEILHMQAYAPDRLKANDTPTSAIEPASIAEAIDEHMGTGQEYSVGKFSSVLPDANNICKVPKYDQETKIEGDVNLTYEWSNLQVLVTAESNGIYFGADLVRTEDDCTAHYKVSAVYPVLHCGTEEGEHGPATAGEPDNGICTTGHGEDLDTNLSPDLEYECEAHTLTCVPKNDFPAALKRK